MADRIPLGGMWPILPKREDLERTPIGRFASGKRGRGGGGGGNSLSGDIVDEGDAGVEGVLVTLENAWLVSGFLLDAESDPLVGVEVTLSGDEDDTTTTDSNGEYSFVLLDGSYTITPSPDSYTFTDDHEDVSVSGANVAVTTMVGAPKTFFGAISFDSVGTGDEYSFNTDPITSGLSCIAGWEWWRRISQETGTYLPQLSGIPELGGYTPNEFGDRMFSWKHTTSYLPSDHNHGSPYFVALRDAGYYLDTVNGCRVALCMKKSDGNGAYNWQKLVLASSAGGYGQDDSTLREANDFIELRANGRNINPDQIYCREVVGYSTVGGGAWYNTPGTQGNWTGDTDAAWMILGVELPPGMTGTIKGYFNVPGIYSAGVLVDLFTLVGDWSNRPLDVLGHWCWQRYPYEGYSHLAWYWVGALTDDWPA